MLCPCFSCPALPCPALTYPALPQAQGETQGFQHGTQTFCKMNPSLLALGRRMTLPDHEPSLLKAVGYHSKLSARAKQAATSRAEARWKDLQERIAAPWVPDPALLQQGIARLLKSDNLLDLAGGDVAEAQRRLDALHAKIASPDP